MFLEEVEERGQHWKRKAHSRNLCSLMEEEEDVGHIHVETIEKQRDRGKSIRTGLGAAEGEVVVVAATEGRCWMKSMVLAAVDRPSMDPY